MNILRDKVLLDIHSNKSGEELKKELLLKIQTSGTLFDNSKAYQKSLYFESRKLNYLVSPISPCYSIRIKFDPHLQDSNIIATAVVQGNIAIKAAKYGVIFLVIIILGFASYFSQFGMEILHAIGMIVASIVLFYFLHYINLEYIEEGKGEALKLLQE